MAAEYARFGDGFVKRTGPDRPWRECPLDDVPQKVLDELAEVEARKKRVAQFGFDPENPPAPPKIIRGGE